jgi:hypothetical protein
MKTEDKKSKPKKTRLDPVLQEQREKRWLKWYMGDDYSYRDIARLELEFHFKEHIQGKDVEIDIKEFAYMYPEFDISGQTVLNTLSKHPEFKPRTQSKAKLAKNSQKSLRGDRRAFYKTLLANGHSVDKIAVYTGQSEMDVREEFVRLGV